MSLPWIRFETGFASSPQIRRLAKDKRWRAISVFVCGLSWCGVHAEETGVIPDWCLDAFYGDAKSAQQLLDVGLWAEVPGGFVVVNWEKYQGEFLKRRRASAVANHEKYKDRPDHHCDICKESA